MSEYVSCPTCHGRGLIPLEDAERIEAHASTRYEEQRQRQRDTERAMVETDNRLRRMSAEERQAEAERRLAELEQRAAGGHEAAGDQS